MSFSLRRLLELQREDTLIDQLIHKRAGLPQRDALSAQLKEAAELRRQLEAASRDRDATASQLVASEAEVSGAEQRISAINARLYGTEPISPKDAQAMTEEVAHLKVRLSSFEDNALEVMEQLEPKQIEVARLEGEARDLAARLGVTQQELNESEAEIDAQLASQRDTREKLAKEVDTSLLVKYEALRPRLGGVAVAALEGMQCGGCHLSLAARELDRVKSAKPDEVVNCEECGRILVLSS